MGETYRIGFVMARRGNYNAHLGRTFTLTMGGQNLGMYGPMTTTWEQALTGAVVANATSLQLVLEAGAEPGNDSMALIDDVAVMPAHPHAARAMGNGNSFEYDANGNMTVRREKLDGISYVYTQTWTIDNRLTSVVKSDETGTILATTTISYDGDGVRVKKTDPSGATYYLGVVEVLITGTMQVTTSYYAFDGAMVAMRTAATATLTYLHGDHLGSTSLTTNAAGQKVSEQRYKPYGEVRWSSGAGMPTDFTFTSQRAGPANYVGSLMDYVARGYSPALGRFVSADTIVPTLGSSIALNRYAYVFDSPLVYQDPSGHCAGPSAILCIAVMALLVSACTNETPRLTPSPSGAPDKFDGKFPVLAERSHEMTDGSPYQPIATVPPGSDGAGGGNPGVGIPPGSGMNGYGQTHKVDPSNGGLSMALGVILGATGGYFPYSRGSQAYGSYRDSIQQTAKSAGYEAQEHKFDVTTFDRFLAGASRPALMLLPVTYLNGASNGIYGAGEREVFAILRGLSSDKKFVIFDNPVDGLGKIELPAEFFLDKLYWTFSEQK